jgi:hypothetical protein
MPPSEMRTSLNGESKRRVAGINMVGIPTRTCAVHFWLSFHPRSSPKETELRREQTETNVTVPVKLLYGVNAQSPRGLGNGPLGWTVRAF